MDMLTHTSKELQMREAANKYMGVQNKCKCGTPQALRNSYCRGASDGTPIASFMKAEGR